MLFGDMNVNLLNGGDTKTERYTAVHLSHGFSILNRISKNMATRIANYKRGNQVSTSISIIDHILTDINNHKYYLSLIDTPISDHRQIILSFDDNSLSHINRPSIHEPHTYQTVNLLKFSNKFNQANISEINDFEGLNSLLTQIKQNCLEFHTARNSNLGTSLLNATDILN